MTPDAILERWACAQGGEVKGVTPPGYDRPAPKFGLTETQQIALWVESLPGWCDAREAVLWWHLMPGKRFDRDAVLRRLGYVPGTRRYMARRQTLSTRYVPTMAYERFRDEVRAAWAAHPPVIVPRCSDDGDDARRELMSEEKAAKIGRAHV